MCGDVWGSVVASDGVARGGTGSVVVSRCVCLCVGRVARSEIAVGSVVRPSLGPMRDLVVVGGAAVGRRGSANYVGGCWRSSHIRCRKCAVGYAARNASAHHKAVHRQQRHHRQRSTWRHWVH